MGSKASALHAEQQMIEYIGSIANSLPENTRVMMGIANVICGECQLLGTAFGDSTIVEVSNGVRIILLGFPK